MMLQKRGDEIVIATNGTLKIGQPMCLDVTQFGPDNNVPNNGAPGSPTSDRAHLIPNLPQNACVASSLAHTTCSVSASTTAICAGSAATCPAGAGARPKSPIF